MTTITAILHCSFYSYSWPQSNKYQLLLYMYIFSMVNIACTTKLQNANMYCIDFVYDEKVTLKFFRKPINKSNDEWWLRKYKNSSSCNERSFEMYTILIAVTAKVSTWHCYHGVLVAWHSWQTLLEIMQWGVGCCDTHIFGVILSFSKLCTLLLYHNCVHLCYVHNTKTTGWEEE